MACDWIGVGGLILFVGEGFSDLLGKAEVEKGSQLLAYLANLSYDEAGRAHPIRSYPVSAFKMRTAFLARGSWTPRVVWDVNERVRCEGLRTDEMWNPARANPYAA